MPIKVKSPRTVAAAAAAAIAALLFAIPAGAHVTVAPTEAPAEGYAKLDFSVPHGCEDSPTTSISIQMPDQVVSVTPQVVAGWQIETKEGELARPVELHGETITTGVREVTWRGGPLDPHHLEVFGLSVRFAGQPDDRVPFKIVQRCRQGEEAWIEVAEDGGEEPEFPAPIVTLTTADDGHGHDAAADGDEEPADAEAVTGDQGTSDTQVAPMSEESADDDGNGPLPAIALAVAILALITSGISLTRRRQ